MFVILLLAAGQGRRFNEAGGRTYKLLAPMTPSSTVLRRACETLLQTAWPVYVVSGTHELEMRKELGNLDVNFISNPDAASGLGDSIARGVAATADADGWLLALGDMPFIQPDTILRVARAMQTGAAIAFPTHEGRRGHPVGFSRRFTADLMSLHGDTGAQKILGENKALCVPVPVQDDGIFRDIDLPADLPPAA
jgi:molybdenum cofactor cytidylyltransferase